MLGKLCMRRSVRSCMRRALVVLSPSLALGCIAPFIVGKLVRTLHCGAHALATAVRILEQDTEPKSAVHSGPILELFGLRSEPALLLNIDDQTLPESRTRPLPWSPTRWHQQPPFGFQTPTHLTFNSLSAHPWL